MTVCVSVKVHDCIVFAADSATTLLSMGGDNSHTVSNVYLNGNKVFNLYRDLPIASMTAGMGNIGPQSISVLSKNLRKLMGQNGTAYHIDKNNYTIEEVAEKCRNYFYVEKYLKLTDDDAPQGEHQFDYWVGGFSSHSDLPELWKVTILNGDCDDPRMILDQRTSSIAWGGQPEAISRLVLGYGQGLPDALAGMGLTEPQLSDVLSELASKLATPLVTPAMPTQDAIDLAEFLVHTSKMYVRFLPGANTVGGETDVAAITKHEGFKWVQRKHYFFPDLNPRIDR